MAIVYRHIRLDNGKPFYIGIGKTLSRAYQTRNRNVFWQNITAKHGYEVEILMDNISYEQACEKEKEFIKLYGRKNINNGLLCNLTDGGDTSLGYKPTQETLAKISATSKGRVKSEEQILKWKSKMSFILSEETKQKIRTSLTGKKRTEEAKKNMRKAHLGKKLSEAAKQKLKNYYKINSQKWKGTKLSEEQRKKLSISHTGKFGILSSNKKAIIKIIDNQKFEFFSIAEAAKHHNLSSQTISKYIKGKTKPKDNSSWYFKKSFEEIKK